MKCEECIALVEEEGVEVLGAESADEFTAHLDICSACRELYEEERREREIYSRYLLAVNPNPAMWSKLEAKIEQERESKEGISAARILQFHPRLANAFSHARSSFALPIAATILLVCGLAAFFLMRNDQLHTATDREMATQLQGLSDAGQQNAAVPDASNFSDTSDDVRRLTMKSKPDVNRLVIRARDDGNRIVKPTTSVAGRRKLARHSSSPRLSDEITASEIVSGAEMQRLKAIATLSRDIAIRRPEMDAEKIVPYQEAIAVIDRTIKDTRLAVRENPRDPVAVQQMFAAYGKKIDVLEEIANIQD